MKIEREEPINFHYKFTCKGCRSDLAANAEDVQASSSDDVYHFFVTCPLCGTVKHISAGILEKRVIEMAIRKARGE